MRKRSFLVGESIYCLWPIKSLSKEKILKTIRLENRLSKLDFPVRRWQKIGQSWVKKIHFEGKNYWLGKGRFLPGRPAVIWTPKKLFSAGKTLAVLHQKTRKGSRSLLHLDFARSNLLFDKNDRVVGILDFEEAGWGKPELDIACSLSFLVVDSPSSKRETIFEHFLAGYRQAGSVFSYDKIERNYQGFLKKRMEEGNLPTSRPTFLVLAKKKLEGYKQQVAKKIIGPKDLKNFRQKNKNKKIIFTVGAFELLHFGHLEYLQRAKVMADLSVIGVASNESRRKLKGEPYPLITDQTRAETLAHFPFVDAVIVVNEEDVSRELSVLRPKIFYTVSKDWQEKIRKLTEEKIVKRYDGLVIKSGYLSPNISSTQMIEKVALMKIRRSLFPKVKRQPLLHFKKERKIDNLVKFADLDKFGQKIHQLRKTIVFASGTADLFHLGHARFFQKAKSLADILVVGIPSNDSVRALKGPGRPLVDERARALVMANLEWVDWVVIFDERTILGCLQKLKPDIFFTVKEDWNLGFMNAPEAQFMKSTGGKIVRSEKQSPYLSASKMIDKAAGELIQKKFSDLIKIARETPVFDADNGFDPHSPQAQLAARERGFYEKVLEAVAQRGKCVFCDLKEKYLIAQKDGVVLTVALFPYIDGHLLIIPRRHIELMKELNEKEREAVFHLSALGGQLLKKKLGIGNVWFLLREGQGIKVGKTVDHLHFHLLPYNPKVIKMGETELKVTPLAMAKKLKAK